MVLEWLYGPKREVCINIFDLPHFGAESDGKKDGHYSFYPLRENGLLHPSVPKRRFQLNDWLALFLWIMQAFRLLLDRIQSHLMPRWHEHLSNSASVPFVQLWCETERQDIWAAVEICLGKLPAIVPGPVHNFGKKEWDIFECSLSLD